MFGHAWEGPEEIAKTVKLARMMLAKGWASTLQCTITIPYPGTPLFKELAANDGASNNSPFTLSVTDSDKYTYTLSAAAADETTVTITTDGSNTRVILFAVKAE